MIQTIGILGGGQLGRMMAFAAKAMGYKIIVLDPNLNCPTNKIADKQIVANYNNIDAAKELYNCCDVITYEFENVDLNVANILEVKLPQTSRLLEITQNRILEKQEIKNGGLKTVHYEIVNNANTLENFKHKYFQNPTQAIIKSAIGGYDGKSQFKIKSIKDFEKFEQESYDENIQYIIEDFIEFEKEISVVVCRNKNKQVAIFPIAENIHKNQILQQSIVPARVNNAIHEKAIQLAEHLANHLNLIGTIAIELFVYNDELIVNELAPRPHNSGHYTLNACLTSQFEQHIRAICNLPLRDTSLVSPCVMLNILGEDNYLLNTDNIKEFAYHFYEKEVARVGRKMGHINIIKNSVEECLTLSSKLINLNKLN